MARNSVYSASLIVAESWPAGGSRAAAATTCMRGLTTTSRSGPTGGWKGPGGGRRKRADRVGEVAAVGHAEALGHRDLHRRDVRAVPDRLEDRVREAEVKDLREA